MKIYQLSVKDTLKSLGSRMAGLTSDEASSRLEKYGKNEIQIKKKISFFALLAKQFSNFLIWLLIIVALVAFTSGFYLKKQEQLIDGVIVSLIVIINSFVGAYHNYKSEKSAELLKSMLRNEAMTIREGKKIKIDSAELVSGDIILLKEGAKVPADCRIIECNEFSVDESMLTGESLHVLKNSKQISQEVPLADRENMVFMNTFVAQGEATCVVSSTGKVTEVGKIAKSLEIEEESLFLDEVDEASKKIAYVAFALIFLALTIYYFHEHSWMSIFMLGSALIIGSIPEGLPAIVTFALAMGSSKLSKKKVLVKRKTLLETLGSVDVICTDKTGTLTENKMAVRKLYADGKIKNNLSQINPNTLKVLGRCALLCNEAKDTEKGFAGPPEDIALVDYFFINDKLDIIKLREKYPRVQFEPFSSEKKYSSTHNRVESKIIRYSKGAPEIILDQSNKIIKNGKIVRLKQDEKEAITKAAKKFSDESLRNLAFSYNDIFIGLIGMHDHPKEGIRNVIKSIYTAGIEIKMVTGDNLHTATAIAKECGFKNLQAVNGDEIKNLSEEELKKAVAKHNIFSRMSPDHKLKIVTALQAIGKRVAITGDGVNDVPALKKADVGVAMGKKGSDIAKEAADLIILDDNLDSILAGIREGRTIFENIRKVINYLLTANLAEVLLVFFASLMGLIPFLAIQLLWVNFVTDIAPAMALGIDPSHDNTMKQKPTGKNEKLINRKIVWLTIGISIKKVIIMFFMFLIILKVTDNLPLAQTMTFTWLVLSHFVRVAAIRFEEKLPFFANKYLNWAIIIPVVVQLIILYSPLSKFFQTVFISIKEWVLLVGLIFLAIFLAKVITKIIDKNLPESGY